VGIRGAERESENRRAEQKWRNEGAERGRGSEKRSGSRKSEERAILEVKSKSQKRPSHAKHCILEAFCTRYGESEVWTITGGGRPALSTPSKSHCSSPYKLLILQETPTFIAPIR
jgi:hypothetical protein